jgi:hypothetical protein
MAARRPSLAIALVLAVVLPLAAAHAELAKWDQAKVSALSKQLAEATKALQDTFSTRPPPNLGSGDSHDYLRLKQVVRRIRQEATALDSDIRAGGGMEATQNSYETLMTNVRDAREIAGRIFATQDIKDRATAVRTVLNQLAPYYDPDAVPLEPSMR